MRRHCNGFTLVEVLIAVAVFGIMTVLAYATLGQTLDSVEFLGDRYERLKALQRTIRVIDGDLQQLSPRPIRDPLTDATAAALRAEPGGGFALELSRMGWNNPAGLKRSNQQRVAYRLEEDVLVRVHWLAMDPSLAEEPVRAELIDGVESLVVRYLGANGEWSAEWPPAGRNNPAAASSRPRAVEVLLTLYGEGEIRRLLEVAP